MMQRRERSGGPMVAPMVSAPLDRFFRPRSVALVGAPRICRNSAAAVCSRCSHSASTARSIRSIQNIASWAARLLRVDRRFARTARSCRHRGADRPCDPDLARLRGARRALRHPVHRRLWRDRHRAWPGAASRAARLHAGNRAARDGPELQRDDQFRHPLRHDLDRDDQRAAPAGRRYRRGGAKRRRRPGQRHVAQPGGRARYQLRGQQRQRCRPRSARLHRFHGRGRCHARDPGRCSSAFPTATSCSASRVGPPSAASRSWRSSSAAPRRVRAPPRRIPGALTGSDAVNQAAFRPRRHRARR